MVNLSRGICRRGSDHTKLTVESPEMTTGIAEEEKARVGSYDVATRDCCKDGRARTGLIRNVLDLDTFEEIELSPL